MEKKRITGPKITFWTKSKTITKPQQIAQLEATKSQQITQSTKRSKRAYSNVIRNFYQQTKFITTKNLNSHKFSHDKVIS